MTNEELIARQAKEIEELKDKIENRNAALSAVHGVLFSIGGPLNDNVDGYTNRQLLNFSKIAKLITL